MQGGVIPYSSPLFKRKFMEKKEPSLWDSIKAKTAEAVAPYQMGVPSNKVHQIYSQPKPKGQ
jgi:hypothetical protein